MTPENSTRDTLISEPATKCESESTSKVNECLNQRRVCFEYLASNKVYDPKHPPIIDKGTTYYFQENQSLYRKIKKSDQILKS